MAQAYDAGRWKRLPATDHTRLLNKFIGLCTRTDDWPQTLHKIGFRVQLVEQRIALEGNSITPDIVSVSDPLSHALVVDCKGGKSIDLSQDAKYVGIRHGDLANWVTVRERGRLTHTACYATSDASHDKLRNHTTLPFIVFGKDIVRGVGSFGQPKLDEAICKEISLRGSREPRSLYPFSPDDHPSVALPFIIKGVVHCATNADGCELADFTTEAGMRDAIKIVHLFYERMGTRHARLLASKAAAWFAEMLEEDDDLRGLYKKLLCGGSDVRTVQAFADRCMERIDLEAQQSRMADTP